MDLTSTPFVTEDWSVRWGDVGAAAVSFVLVSIAGGLANVIEALFNLPIAIANGIADTLRRAVATLFDIQLRFGEAKVFALVSDIGGFAVAMFIVGIGIFLVASAVRRAL